MFKGRKRLGELCFILKKVSKRENVTKVQERSYSEKLSPCAEFLALTIFAFVILHKGSIESLRFSKTTCDLLTQGVNDTVTVTSSC